MPRERISSQFPSPSLRDPGAQLSVVGIRIVHLCSTYRADDIERWQRNRPNALLPGLLPTVDTEG